MQPQVSGTQLSAKNSKKQGPKTLKVQEGSGKCILTAAFQHHLLQKNSLRLNFHVTNDTETILN